MSGLNRRQASAAAHALKPFSNSTGSLTGIVGGAQHMTGRLNDAERARFLSDGHHGIDYTVISYATPIAWVCQGEWYRVEQKFSQTTSCHMGLLPVTGARA